MSSSHTEPLASVVFYADREGIDPRMGDPLPERRVVTASTRREARRQQRQRLASERAFQRAVHAVKYETRKQEEAEAARRELAEMSEISVLLAEVFELVTQQDAWNSTFRARFKTRLAYKLHSEHRNENFQLAADGRIWVKLSDSRRFMPFKNLKNPYLNERMRADLLPMLQAARSHLKMR